MKKISITLFLFAGAIFLAQFFFSVRQSDTEAAVTEDTFTFLPVVTKPQVTPTPSPTVPPPAPTQPPPGQPRIDLVTVPSRVNKFEKLEIDFQISGLSGQNLQLPYLTAADANQYTQDFVNDGVTVDAIFFAPNGTQYRQPAFWHEGYDNNLQSTDNSRWTVRFAPHMAGQWTVKITAVSRDGALESEFGAFTVDDSAEKGFLQVSKNDSRYFEFDNGDYFSNLGFNYSIRALRQSAEAENLSQNGVNYLRVWASRLNIVGGAWSHLSMKPTVYDGYLPRDAVARYFPEGSSDEEFWWRISHNHSWYSSCLYTNQEYERIRMKPNTDYLVQTEFATYDVVAADQSKPYGYSVVIQDWVDHCSQLDGNNGITSYSGGQNQQNLVSSGTWNSGDSSTIPFVYPAPVSYTHLTLPTKA